MIHLFPKLKNKTLIMCACCIAFAGVYLAMNRAANPLVILIALIIALLLVVFSQLVISYNVHNQLLGILYNQMNVDGFLRQYEPFLKLNLQPNLHLMVRLHLSNAYCAQGRFSDAKALLESVTVSPGKKPEDELLSRFALVSNLCYIAQQQEDAAAAQKLLNQLLEYKGKLEALQLSKPEKKRMVFNTELNEQVMSFMNTGKADLEALRTLVQNNPQQLHRVTISLWLARAYLAENNRREAEKLLERIVNLAPELYPGKTAAALLASLPGNHE
ncbi:MAG: tetratricopeptide repeat protein [Clostridia bacterium]|nr:tetratricopeptide repeat protein [Clostridia bacterium]